MERKTSKSLPQEFFCINRFRFEAFYGNRISAEKYIMSCVGRSDRMWRQFVKKTRDNETDGRKEGQMDRQTDGQTDRQTDRRTEGRTN